MNREMLPVRCRQYVFDAYVGPGKVERICRAATRVFRATHLFAVDGQDTCLVDIKFGIYCQFVEPVPASVFNGTYRFMTVLPRQLMTITVQNPSRQRVRFKAKLLGLEFTSDPWRTR